MPWRASDLAIAVTGAITLQWPRTGVLVVLFSFLVLMADCKGLSVAWNITITRLARFHGGSRRLFRYLVGKV
jgi:hypothetical protein